MASAGTDAGFLARIMMRKSVAADPAGDRDQRAQAVARALEPRLPRHRLHHRRRHLRAHRQCRGAPCRPGRPDLLRHRRHRLRLRRPLLCRAVLDPAGLGLRLHLQLHDDRRVRGLDHGRAAAARIWPCRLGRRGRLVGLYGQPARRYRHPHTGRRSPARPGTICRRLASTCSSTAHRSSSVQPAGLPGLRRARPAAGASACRKSAKFNNVIVAIKVTVLAAFILVGGFIILTNLPTFAPNWDPFIPEPTGEKGEFGWSGILRAASIVFFAYIGFEAVSTAGQEAKNPNEGHAVRHHRLAGRLHRHLHPGVDRADADRPLHDRSTCPIRSRSRSMRSGRNGRWFAKTIKVGAIIGLTSVILVLMYGQTRIFYTMARDGLLPRVFATRPPEVPHALDQHAPRRPRRRDRRRLLRHQLPRRRDLGRNARGLRASSA